MNSPEALGDDIDIIVHCVTTSLISPSAIKVAEAAEPIKPSVSGEDPPRTGASDAWVALRRTTRVPLMVGENIVLAEGALPFLQTQAVDCLQPDLINCGGITAANASPTFAALYRIPFRHNVSGYVLNMASQQARRRSSTVH